MHELEKYGDIPRETGTGVLQVVCTVYLLVLFYTGWRSKRKAAAELPAYAEKIQIVCTQSKILLYADGIWTL